MAMRIASSSRLCSLHVTRFPVHIATCMTAVTQLQRVDSSAAASSSFCRHACFFSRSKCSMKNLLYIHTQDLMYFEVLLNTTMHGIPLNVSSFLDNLSIISALASLFHLRAFPESVQRLRIMLLLANATFRLSLI
jgi:hypothetical protein